MDFVGEIVEHEVEAPVAPTAPPGSATGFPEPGRLRKDSRWKTKTRAEREQKAPQKELSEAEKIHKENMERISSMTEEEISHEQQELLNGLDPKLIQSLLKRTQKREVAEQAPEHKHSDSCSHEGHTHAEGYNGWIGGVRTANGLADLSHLDKDDVDKALGIHKLSLDDDLKDGETVETTESATSSRRSSADKPKKSVKFNTVATIKYEDLDAETQLDPDGWEDVDDLNDLIPGHEEIAHDDYQLVNEADENRIGVHFLKPKQKQQDDLDLNDPDFYDKLHEKYYPDLPKETQKLSWMTEPLPKQVSTTYDSIGDMRFDFQGNLLELNDETANTNTEEVPTYMGLHHHSENPQLPGYTLRELAHLSRSVMPGQRCLSIQMLGRILHKLGLHKYDILPIDETDPEDKPFNDNLKELVANFEKLTWELIEQLRIIESITEAADESKTRNLSIRNYAIEALWLWKQGGGKPEEAKAETEEDVITKAVQN